MGNTLQRGSANCPDIRSESQITKQFELHCHPLCVFYSQESLQDPTFGESGSFAMAQPDMIQDGSSMIICKYDLNKCGVLFCEHFVVRGI